MTSFTYFAKRELNESVSPVHAEGTAYSVAVSLVEFDRRRKVAGKTVRSLSGLSATTYYRSDTEYACRTVPVTGDDLLNMREFLASVEGGERFQIGLTYYELVDDYSEFRAVRRGNGGDDDYFAFSWVMREV